MSTTTQPAWKHSDVFPIIARIIGEEHQRQSRFIVAHEIATRLLQDSEARAIIDAARQQHFFENMQRAGPNRPLPRSLTDTSTWCTRQPSARLAIVRVPRK